MSKEIRIEFVRGEPKRISNVFDYSVAPVGLVIRTSSVDYFYALNTVKSFEAHEIKPSVAKLVGGK